MSPLGKLYQHGWDSMLSDQSMGINQGRYNCFNACYFWFALTKKLIKEINNGVMRCKNKLSLIIQVFFNAKEKGQLISWPIKWLDLILPFLWCELIKANFTNLGYFFLKQALGPIVVKNLPWKNPMLNLV